MGAPEPTSSLIRRSLAVSRALAWFLKRLLETFVAGVALVLLSPVWLVIALAVWSSSRGPVLFRQRRVGRGGRPFNLLKFRTMEVNTDSDTTWSVDTDSRITPVGRFLRDTSLDELPQLLNVLGGQMALVGPRPERPYFVRQFGAEVPDYAARHRVRPGITGWAQVHGLRGDSSIPDRVRLDNDYIDNWSLRRDAVIVVRTVVEMAGFMRPGSLAATGRKSRSRDVRPVGPTPNVDSEASLAQKVDSALGGNDPSTAVPRRYGPNGDDGAAPGQAADRVAAPAVPPVRGESSSPAGSDT